jgi:hypothetical protein
LGLEQKVAAGCESRQGPSDDVGGFCSSEYVDLSVQHHHQVKLARKGGASQVTLDEFGSGR